MLTIFTAHDSLALILGTVLYLADALSPLGDDSVSREAEEELWVLYG